MRSLFAPIILLAFLSNLALAPGFWHAAFSDATQPEEATAAIHESRVIRGEWSPPARVNIFGAELPAGEGDFSPNGRWFYFSSDRAPSGKWRPRVFRAPVKRGVFGAPVLVDHAVPQSAGTYYPRQLANGDLFFTSKRVRVDSLLQNEP